MTSDEEDDPKTASSQTFWVFGRVGLHVISVFLIGHTRFLEHIGEHIVSLVLFLVFQNLLEFIDQVVDLLNHFTARNPFLELRENDITSSCQLHFCVVNNKLYSQWRCYSIHDFVILGDKWTVIVFDGTEVMSKSS